MFNWSCSILLSHSQVTTSIKYRDRNFSSLPPSLPPPLDAAPQAEMVEKGSCENENAQVEKDDMEDHAKKDVVPETDLDLSPYKNDLSYLQGND
jgi:hypothetical protein